MSDPNFSGPSHSAYPLAPSPPALRPHEPGSLTSSYANFAPFPAYDTPTFHHYPGSFRPQLPDPYSVHSPYQQHRYHQNTMNGGSRAPGYHASPPGMFHPRYNGPVGSDPTPNHIHGPPAIQGSVYPDFTDYRSPNAMLPMIDPAMRSGLSGYSSPSHSPWSPPPLHDFHRRSHSGFSGPLPMLGRPGGEAIRSGEEGRGPSRRLDSVFGDTARPPLPLGGRPSYDRHGHAHNPGTPERRSSALLGAPTHRSDRSISPRISNRRSFDRYSTDLSQSSNPPDSGDGVHATSHRARRPRTMGLNSGYRQRMLASHDPNVPTASQMQALKDKLRHFLPSNLPEGASPMCDICQKDYSAKHVLPTEDEEVAIQLPCKHVFGEHCINTWFETCKTHKNKITCPMCRKLLIEPAPLAPDMFRHFTGLDRSVIESLLRDRQLLDHLAAGDFEGEFTSS